MNIDPEALARAARELTGLSTRMNDELQRLSATVHDGSPWGADEPGTKFGTVYVEVLAHAEAAIASYVAQVADAGARLDRQAREVAATEAHNLTMVREAGGPPR
ncbi:WXG100 family type VII secretion target [Catenuloplanes sp. NPDC051500]|uniref:WXG100 family type VII secretion target n=1 Tax=Catenuloplanes sp. NPDC051500 TaxID=3363959 RepID=UPI00378D4815